MKKIIAIIPARGGSKRLPRKNVLPLGGIPLLARVIRTVKDSGVFEKIVVSSEDTEILALAQKEAAVAHARPLELASDRSTVVETCINVLESYPSDSFCCIYATAALISKETLKSSSKIFLSDGSVNVLMGVSKYNYHPAQALRVLDDGTANLLFPDFQHIQSQFYPDVRVSNGTFYWAKTNNFLEEKTFYSTRLRLFDVPCAEVCDIDTESDFLRLTEIFNSNCREKNDFQD